jgi:arginase
MQLVDGATTIRGDLPTAATQTVPVPLEAGDSQGTSVHRLSAILLVRDRLLAALSITPGPVITIGGDCGVEVGAVGHVSDRDIALVWFDAHPDLNSPESSGTGAFHGMVLRTILGDGPAALVPSTPLTADRVILVGVRASDAAEEAFSVSAGIRSLSVDELSPDSLVAAVQATGAASVYLHIDLDVLDPADMTQLGFPEPFGVRAETLVATIKALLARFPLAGAGITEFAPASMADAAEDMPTLLRIIGALATEPRD